MKRNSTGLKVFKKCRKVKVEDKWKLLKCRNKAR